MSPLNFNTKMLTDSGERVDRYLLWMCPAKLKSRLLYNLS